MSEELSWWSTKLASPLSRPIPAPLKLIDLHAFSDASSGISIAIFIQGRWRAWCLISGWQSLDGSQDIGWAKVVGFKLFVRPGLEALGATLRSSTITKELSKDGGILEAKNKPTNSVFHKIHSFLTQFNHSVSIYSAYIPSKSNPADPPSRGLYPPAELLLSWFQPPANLYRFIVDSSLPSPLPKSIYSTKVVTLQPLPTALENLSRDLVPLRTHHLITPCPCNSIFSSPS
jgi:hypothetical protein